MTRRHLLAGFAVTLAFLSAFPATAGAAEKSKKLEVTYYYLPG